MDKKHPKLIGMSFHDERELNSMKEVADYITKSNDEDGIAKWLEEYYDI